MAIEERVIEEQVSGMMKQLRRIGTLLRQCALGCESMPYVGGRLAEVTGRPGSDSRKPAIRSISWAPTNRKLSHEVRNFRIADHLARNRKIASIDFKFPHRSNVTVERSSQARLCESANDLLTQPES
jgi:hypothetical protein